MKNEYTYAIIFSFFIYELHTETYFRWRDPLFLSPQKHPQIRAFSLNSYSIVSKILCRNLRSWLVLSVVYSIFSTTFRYTAKTWDSEKIRSLKKRNLNNFLNFYCRTLTLIFPRLKDISIYWIIIR